MPPPTGVVNGPLMATTNSAMALTESSVSHSPNWLNAFSPAKISYQTMRRLPAVCLLDCGIEDALGCSPDVAAGAVAFDKRNDRAIGHIEFDAVDGNLLTVGGNFYTIERRH